MLKRGFKDMLAEANSVIETVSIQDLPYLLEDPEVILLDVRDESERDREGVIPGSEHASRGLLEFHADPDSELYNPVLKQDRRIVVYCATGGRSALAAKTLLEMGYLDVASLAGGYVAWRLAQKR